MRIAILSRFQNTVSRGVENFVLELSKRLSENHQVDVLSGNDADDIMKVIKGDYDVVIPTNGRLQSLKASLGRVIGGYKLLITGHSGIGRDDIWNIAVCKPDVFVALTDRSFAWAKSWAWGTRVVKIPDGVDLEKFSPEGEKIELGLSGPIILSVGALVWYKHHEKLINALSKIDKGSLLVVGKGEMRKKFEGLGEKLLPNRFKILDFNYEDMPKVYRSCDLFSLPSWDREAFGIVYLEALSSGLGVVAPDDQSRREIIGDAGILTNVDDPVNYAAELKKALTVDWSKKAQVQALKFSWKKIAEDYDKLMVNITAER